MMLIFEGDNSAHDENDACFCCERKNMQRGSW